MLIHRLETRVFAVTFSLVLIHKVQTRVFSVAFSWVPIHRVQTWVLSMIQRVETQVQLDADSQGEFSVTFTINAIGILAFLCVTPPMI